MQDAYNTQSTTEELIIAYLDGELVRKELEVELFDRLAVSMEARTILRDHLVIRGAIKQSMLEDRFILSDDLDQRTRARLEEILENVSAPTIAARSSRVADAGPVRLDQPARSLKRWRYSTAALLLLLAFGTTWFVTQELDEPTLAVQQQPSVQQPAVAVIPAAPTSNSPEGASVAAASPKEADPKVIVKTVVRTKYVPVPASAQLASRSSSESDNVKVEEAKPEDVMISHRVPKLLRNTKSNTVVITDKDRI
jgi:hypothetical protein